VDLEMIDQDENAKQMEKIKQDMMFQKNLQRKTFNNVCLVNFAKINMKQFPMKELKSDLDYE
jgi:hypothetical protein